MYYKLFYAVSGVLLTLEIIRSVWRKIRAGWKGKHWSILLHANGSRFELRITGAQSTGKAPKSLE